MRLNWTSAKVPYWQSDCDAYRKLAKPFELRDVESNTQEAFAILYALQFDFEYKRDGSTVIFTPR